MASLGLPHSAIAFFVAACGGYVDSQNSIAGPANTATGGTSGNNTTATAPPSNTDSGLPSGIVKLTPDQWDQLNNGACVAPTLIAAGDASVLDHGLACSYTVQTSNGQPPDPKKINLFYTHGNPASDRYLIAPSDANCALGNGWYFEPSAQLDLCAQTCAMLQQDPAATLDIQMGCGGPVIID